MIKTAQEHRIYFADFLQYRNTRLSSGIAGEFRLAKPLKPGDKIFFSEMGAYTFFQADRFNRMKMPALIWSSRKESVCNLTAQGELWTTR